ncbi:MAG: (E)-4-hydroxy-3-methylbut-2-enyl-diphosphate synthase, partial [Bacteroidetes bacterium]|nr:(E)-4-hydroxy-3-methylbut-2-enyl-diphosphate synthase [Bacteroidota bacterium]
MKRRKTNDVTIGKLKMGSNFPVRIQSMTTSDTMDTEACVAQSIRMIEAGCELVRLTAPSINEAKNLLNIKNELHQRGYTTPLVADIHYTPNAAEAAAAIVEKVRVNPGNYVDKKKFETLEYTQEEYDEEIERIRARFTPLISICKQNKTAIRIGTNHGSLSDRIMSRYGDTALGMVESALEFIRICRDNDFHEIVVSMKSSNPQVMIHAYRLLIKKMEAEHLHYPLHLGVTEAGDGEDGRIKSAVGIGTLMEEGIGDTIRVSLTEEPEFEVPVAMLIAERYKNAPDEYLIDLKPFEEYNAYEYIRRKTITIANFGGDNVPRVIAHFAHLKEITTFDLQQIGHSYDPVLDKWHMNDMGVDYVYAGNTNIPFMLPNGLKAIYNVEAWLLNEAANKSGYPLYANVKAFLENPRHPELNFVGVSVGDVESLQMLKKFNNVVIFLYVDNELAMMPMKFMFVVMNKIACELPVVIIRNYENINDEQFTIYAGIDAGGLFVDGFGEGLMLHTSNITLSKINSIAFG